MEVSSFTVAFVDPVNRQISDQEGGLCNSLQGWSFLGYGEEFK